MPASFQCSLYFESFRSLGNCSCCLRCFGFECQSNPLSNRYHFSVHPNFAATATEYLPGMYYFGNHFYCLNLASSYSNYYPIVAISYSYFYLPLFLLIHVLLLSLFCYPSVFAKTFFCYPSCCCYHLFFVFAPRRSRP